MDSTELPLLIGVTGHRDLAEPEKVRQQLECFFRKLASAMPNTRFCLLSGLAVGADQLFIECGEKILGDSAETFAVLPFPRDEYRKDFAPGEESEAFDKLLASSDYATELSGDRTDEAAAYRQVGVFLVEHVNILVSVWDGNIACDLEDHPKPGGTWDISYRWMNYEKYKPEQLFSTCRIPTLIWIEAKRLKSANRHDKPSPVKELFDDQSKQSADKEREAKKRYNIAVFDSSRDEKKFFSRYFSDRAVDAALKEIDDYNALRKTETPGRISSKKYLKLASANGVEKEVERFAILDDAANTAQKKYDRQFWWIFSLSFLLGVFAQIYGGIEHDFLSFTHHSETFKPITWTLPMYLVLIILVFSYWLIQKRRKIDDKYIDCRSLAEVLRIDIFWKIAGVGKDVKDFFLLKAPEHAEWITIALNNWSFLDRFAADKKECVNSTDVKTAWVEDQLDYYGSNAQNLHWWATAIYWLAIGVAGISMVFGIYFFIDTFVREITPQRFHEPLYAVNGLLVGFGSFFLASFSFFLEKKGWEETSASYASKKKLFAIVRDCLNVLEQRKEAESDEKRSAEKDIKLAMQINRYASVNDYLVYLGKAALQEHEEWLEQQRKSKPEPNL